MTWLLKIKRRAQNAAVAWLDWPGEKAEGGEVRPYEGDGVPVVLSDDWRSAEPVSLPGDEGWVDEDLVTP